MKPGFLCLALALTAIVGPFSTSAAVDKPARADGIPRVSLREAVSLADEFLRTNKIDTSHHQMLEGTLGIYPGGSNYWDLRWDFHRKFLAFFHVAKRSRICHPSG